MTGESPFCNGTRSGTFETSIQRHNVMAGRICQQDQTMRKNVDNDIGMFYTYYQKIQEENRYDRVPARYL